MSTSTVTPTRLSLGPWLMFGARQMAADMRRRWYLFAIVGLVWVLAVLGAMRELLGAGTLFSGIEMIIPGTSAWNVFGDDYPGFLLAILPPGAFFALGVLIAAYNAINVRLAARARRNPPPAPAPPPKQDEPPAEPAAAR